MIIKKHIHSFGSTWLVVITIAMYCCFVPAAMAEQRSEEDAAQQEITLEPEALDALSSMSRFLRTLSAFEVESKFYRDEVLESGQKILTGGTSSMTVKFPDKLFSKVDLDEKDRSFAMYFDGREFTLYGAVRKFYATVSAPGTLKDLVQKTFTEKGIELPLQDLFIWGTDAADKDAITTAIIIGETTLDGKPCTHYAYRQEGVDWQLWIQDGEQPLPLQLVITTTSDSSQPQYSARLGWNLNPVMDDDLFVFTPPEGAFSIGFLPAAEKE